MINAVNGIFELVAYQIIACSHNCLRLIDIVFMLSLCIENFILFIGVVIIAIPPFQIKFSETQKIFTTYLKLTALSLFLTTYLIYFPNIFSATCIHG